MHKETPIKYAANIKHCFRKKKQFMISISSHVKFFSGSTNPATICLVEIFQQCCDGRFELLKSETGNIFTFAFLEWCDKNWTF